MAAIYFRRRFILTCEFRDMGTCGDVNLGERAVYHSIDVNPVRGKMQLGEPDADH